MSIRSSVGMSHGDNAYSVGADACQDAFDQLGAEQADAVIVFASVAYDQEQMLSGVRSVSGETLLVGSSTAGEITTDGPVKRHSVTVMALKADDVSFYAGVGENIKDGAAEAGKHVGRAVQSQAEGDLKTFMMFPDVLVGNGADIVRGVQQALGAHFPIVGGASGDDFKFEQTYQYLNDTVYTGSVVGLGMTGAFRIGIGVKHGWVPVGAPKQVTKSDGAVIHELDGEPAIKIYEEYFGKDEAGKLREEPLARLAITYPLGMKVEGSDELLIRDPISVDENGSITCAAEIPEGSEIRLMVGSKEEAFKVAKEAAGNAVEQLDGADPQAVLIFNCIARNKLFADRAGEEIDAIQTEIGKSVPLMGFYTYGEQAPLGGEVSDPDKINSTFHNETVVIAVFGDDN